MAVVQQLDVVKSSALFAARSRHQRRCAAKIRAQAMLLIGPALDPMIGQQVGRFDSRLYARDFSHRFRKAGDGENESQPRMPRGGHFVINTPSESASSDEGTDR